MNERRRLALIAAIDTAIASGQAGPIWAGRTLAQMTEAAIVALLEAVWGSAYINDLPDSAFLLVETGGTKDAEGKTTPRNKRHFPYKDTNGDVDLPHLRNALARIPQSALPADAKAKALTKAQAIATAHGITVSTQEADAGVTVGQKIGSLTVTAIDGDTATVTMADGTTKTMAVTMLAAMAAKAAKAAPKQEAGRRRPLLEADDTSLDDLMSRIRQAVSDAYNGSSDGCAPGAPFDYSYVEQVYADHVIVSRGDQLWSVDYAIDLNGDVTLGDTPVQVRKAYLPTAEGMILCPLDDAGQLAEATAATKPSGKQWGVLIIQEGLSRNRNRYGRNVLKAAAPLYEGARIYMDHQEEPRRYGRSTRDLAGFLKGVEGVLVADPSRNADAAPMFALAATACVTKPWVRDELLDAYEMGKPDFYGLSHDVNAESVTVMGDDGPFYDVQKIESVSSVDFVTNPAAGGRVLRLVASDTVPHTLEGDGRMLKKMIDAIKASGNTALIAKLTALGATPSEDQVMALYQEALKPDAEDAADAAKKEAAKKKQEADAAAAAAAAGRTVQVREAEFLEVRRDGLTLFAENTLHGVTLPDPVKAHLRTRLTRRINESASLDALPTKLTIEAEVREQVELFGQLAEKHIIMPASSKPRAEVVKDRRDKVGEQLDAFFGIKREGTLADGTPKVTLVEASRMTSFKNIYIDITGDRNVTGRVEECVRLTESLDSASFDQILGDSITRRMVAEYQQASQAQWRGTIVDVVPVSDFRTQRRMRFGGYTNLAIVGQGGPYPAMASPSDEEATYAPSKRGGTEQITIEMIANDDVGAIRRIPGKLSRAASQTLYEFVFDLLRLNGNVYDGVALAAAGHNNLITTALTSSNISAARLKMKAQTDMNSGKRLGLAPRYVIVPNDLEELAFQLTTSDRVLPDASIASTAAAAAPNFIRKINLQPIVVDYWTDTNDYWFAASMDQTPLIELGFWGGEDPQLFVQDMPNVGSLFSNDAITYKIRHIYGGAVLDFRGFVGAIVA